jgi:hypothetical protein
MPISTTNKSCTIDIEQDNIFSKKNQLKNHLEASKNTKQDHSTHSTSKKTIESPTNTPTLSEDNIYVQQEELETLLDEDRNEQRPEFKNLGGKIQKIFIQDETDLESASDSYLSTEDQKRAKILNTLLSVFVVSLNIFFVLMAYYFKFNQKELLLLGFILANFTFLQLLAIFK